MGNYKFNKKMAKQRAKRGFSDDMCWNMYGWILETFPKMIINLRDMKNGYPELKFEEINDFSIDWIEKVCEQIDDFDIYDDFYKWQLILTRIAWCLEQANEETTCIKNEYEEEYFDKIFKNDYEFWENKNGEDKELEEKYFSRLKDIAEYRNQMKDEAFDLIKKYFWNLWD